MSTGQRRLAAIMFTDVVGYTVFAQRNEAEALKRLEEHRIMLRSILPKHDGQEVKTMGDAFLIEFPSALEAVRCSIDIQREMNDENRLVPEEDRLLLRIGIHLGDVVHSQGDILGDAVNVSSRIEPIADPGGVCISGQVYDHVRNKIDLSMKKLEQKSLKNVKSPVDIYKIVMPWDMKTEKDVELDTRRVAVLPLKNMSPDVNDEYFADGMTEELITSLSSVTGLTVIARTSTMQYKNAQKRISEIGNELGVGTLVEGSVRKSGGKVRITIQLIDARNEGHIWAQNYDKLLDDVFTVQSEVAEKVAEALKVKLVESEKRRIKKIAFRNPEAYNIYLKGMFYFNKRTPEAMRRSIDLFQQSLKLDQTFALGYSGLAQAYYVMAANYLDDPEICYPKAKQYANEALALDDELAEPHAILGGVTLGFDYDPDRAEIEYKRAIELNPSSATVRLWYTHLLRYEKRFSESWKEIHEALELSPLSLIINDNVADEYYIRKECDTAIDLAKKTIEMDSNFPPAYVTLITNFLEVGRYDEAIKTAESYTKLTTLIEAKLMYAMIYSKMGRKEETQKLLSELEVVYKEQHISPFWLATIHFRLGETDEAFEWLEKAYNGHDRYIFVMVLDREFDSLRSDPRYLSIVQRIGLAKHFHDTA
jgi:adenylate cyclase